MIFVKDFGTTDFSVPDYTILKEAMLHFIIEEKSSTHETLKKYLYDRNLLSICKNLDFNYVTQHDIELKNKTLTDNCVKKSWEQFYKTHTTVYVNGNKINRTKINA